VAATIGNNCHLWPGINYRRGNEKTSIASALARGSSSACRSVARPPKPLRISQLVVLVRLSLSVQDVACLIGAHCLAVICWSYFLWSGARSSLVELLLLLEWCSQMVLWQ